MALTRPLAGTEVSAADFGAPVADLVNAITEPVWIDLVLTAPWTNYGAGLPNVGYTVAGKWVRFRGTAKPTSAAAANSTLFAIPGAIAPALGGNVLGSASVGYAAMYFTSGSFAVATAIPSGGFVALDQVSWFRA